MSGTPAAVSVRLRFGAQAVPRGRFYRGKDVPILAEFYDPFAPDVPVTPGGVTFALWRPDGTAVAIDTIVGDGASRGALLPTAQVGEHVLVVSTATPSVEVGRIAFDVVEAEPA